MTDFKNAIVFDLTKVGIAYQIINSFVDAETVHVFEVSPVGTNAVLILVSKDLIALKFIEKECLAFFKSDILNASFIENMNEKLFESYLSQNTPAVKKHFAVIEEVSFANAFKVASQVLAVDIDIVDFRVVRTGIPNLILTFTSDALEKINSLTQNQQISKLTVIENVQPSLKAYFEILK